MELPPGIGPHEGVEFDLIRRGMKRVAVFYGYIPEECDTEVELQGLQAFALTVPTTADTDRARNEPIEVLIVHVPDAEKDAWELADIVRADFEGRASIEGIRRTGRILGYEEWQIEAYLAHSGWLANAAD